MPLSDWDIWYVGNSAGYSYGLTTMTGEPPIVGSKSLLMGGEGEWAIPVDDTHMVGLAAHPNVGSTLGPVNFTRGTLRALVRVFDAFGTGRQQVGLFTQFFGDSRANKSYDACYALLLDGPQNLTAWERVVLAHITADSTIYGQRYVIQYPMVVLAEAPLSTAPAAVTALELTWYCDRGDAMGNQRLVGKVGSSTTYSDLTTRVTWSSTDYPGWSQGQGVTGGQIGLVVRFDWTPDVLDHRITTLWDQTQLDEIAATHMPALRQASRKPLKADPDAGG